MKVMNDKEKKRFMECCKAFSEGALEYYYNERWVPVTGGVSLEDLARRLMNYRARPSHARLMHFYYNPGADLVHAYSKPQETIDAYLGNILIDTKLDLENGN